jgi:hypothetical protein
MDTNRTAVRDLIKKALDNGLTKEEYHDFVSKMEEDVDNVVNQAVHALGHYIVGIDIRIRDVGYGRICERELRDFLERLE